MLRKAAKKGRNFQGRPGAAGLRGGGGHPQGREASVPRPLACRPIGELVGRTLRTGGQDWVVFALRLQGRKKNYLSDIKSQSASLEAISGVIYSVPLSVGVRRFLQGHEAYGGDGTREVSWPFLPHHASQGDTSIFIFSGRAFKIPRFSQTLISPAHSEFSLH